MPYPKISIVTPSLNQGIYLEETILSVLNQNYPNLEYIIIDGGSTDGSVEIIKKYEQQLTCWISEPDKGMYDAIQKGFDKCTGEIMAWIGSDDKYHPGAFDTISEIFTSFAEIHWVSGPYTFFDEKGRTIHVASPLRWSKFDFFIHSHRKGKFIEQESVFWRRSLWEKAGGFVDTHIRYAGDYELWLRFFRYGKLYITTALIGGFRRRSSDQLSLDHRTAYLYEIETLLKKEKLAGIEKHILFLYKGANIILNFLEIFRIFNIPGIRKFLQGILFNYPPVIVFDRKTQKFILSKQG
jgi:glycosyltransferase involved in cell wall biosynthesis